MLVGAAFGAVEAITVDLAVAQPIRVELFGDGGYSLTEAADSAKTGEIMGAAGGGLGAGARVVTTAAETTENASVALAGLAKVAKPSSGPDTGEPGVPAKDRRVGLHRPASIRIDPTELRENSPDHWRHGTNRREYGIRFGCPEQNQGSHFRKRPHGRVGTTGRKTGNRTVRAHGPHRRHVVQSRSRHTHPRRIHQVLPVGLP
ncbi:hypothetical protein [Kitasatospora aureofaciens]|uniref:hypothetical protein n=1 Tax=Kitasatospora aureofaciens TaxID=1894 RepID=UPI00131C1FF1|nr:hypothetical protein [Kitasatospora aureofaciens]